MERVDGVEWLTLLIYGALKMETNGMTRGIWCHEEAAAVGYEILV
ncbi:hypothetical protein COLO4_31903 [Corchorus olitorius]|uniref:Uncharacterized protein n=1 Tax=Corchorus olitorius TaxID=93759 RepID=A0A1R3H311_9ROSI|nr:hypothetical protein COLO4_31903 [Corchorus olitorius]